MKQKTSGYLLGIYNLFLASGAILSGIMMLLGNGLFSEYQSEWIGKVPFKSWIIPGIISIVLYGGGNVLATIYSFKEIGNKYWYMSIIMGGVLFGSIILQVIVLKEWYLASFEILLLSIVQLILSLIALNPSKNFK